MEASPTLLTGAWRDLALLSWRAEAALLVPRLPRGTELDRFEGDCYLSVVALRFLDLALLGLPVPLHQEFAQVNLRFYVRRTVNGEVRRGAVFLRELVPRPVIVAGARLLMNEPFVGARVEAQITTSGEGAAGRLRADYRWQVEGRAGSLWLHAEAPSAPLPPGSGEEFIAERCWGYTPQPHGGTLEYRVQHPRWRVRPGAAAGLEGELEAAFGAEFAELLRHAPDHAFYAEGSEVGMRAPGRI